MSFSPGAAASMGRSRLVWKSCGSMPDRSVSKLIFTDFIGKTELYLCLSWLFSGEPFGNDRLPEKIGFCDMAESE